MSEIKRRIIEFIEKEGIAKESFYKKIGMTSASFRGTAKNTPLNSDAVENILSELPQINIHWLLTGEGPMLTENTNSPNTPQEPINQNQNDMNIELVKMINRKDREIGELQVTIANLREEIGALRTKLESMTFVESQSQKKGAV
jgi:hypothetical protein bfra3_13720